MGDRTFKVVVLGEGCVGKTSISLRYCKNEFHAAHLTTIQAAFLSKRIGVDGKRVQLNLWDTAGQERFHAIARVYYRDAEGAVLVYDVTNYDSFKKVQSWVKELRKMLGKSIAIVIAGNKCDRQRERAVSKEEAMAYAKTVGAEHFDTSAKLNQGLDQMFVALARALVAKGGSAVKKDAGGRGALVITNEPAAAPAKSGGCCG
eukprot:TRINITY_DN833_c0_g1_i1.p1 TRINITY_DN833_c0_g1~~TRINITY_DN833_c0_g1_i1.p1  ORF type:complete len:203 (+),score=35.84 TRINITY_DN833_c0_g1_i1:114-722(+)